MRNNQNKYNYVCYPDNLPLELTGHSKRRVSSLNKEDFNQNKCTLNQQAKSFLLKKLESNIHNFSQTKSVLPEPQRRSVTRLSSIRTFSYKENIMGSGIQYLIQKTESLKPSAHKQKAHVPSISLQSQKISEKKHFHTDRQSLNKSQIKNFQAHHRETSNIKLNQDIYSNPYRQQKQANVRKKMQSNNFFKRSIELGYEECRQKQVSDNKMIEIMGSEHVRIDMNPKVRTKRQDWRISNIF